MESDLKKLINELKNIQPDKDWAVSARANLVRLIEEDTRLSAPSEARGFHTTPRPSWFERTLAQPKWAGAFTLGIFALMIFTASITQNSLPGSPLYPVKIASEDIRTKFANEAEGVNLQVKYTERRVDEINKLASNKLESENAEALESALEGYKKEIQVAQESGDKERIEESIAETNEKVGVLTNIMNEKDPEGTLDNMEILLADCADEKLKTEAEELLESGDWIGMIDAFILLNRCEETDNNEETVETDDDEFIVLPDPGEVNVLPDTETVENE